MITIRIDPAPGESYTFARGNAPRDNDITVSIARHGYGLCGWSQATKQSYETTDEVAEKCIRRAREMADNG